MLDPGTDHSAVILGEDVELIWSGKTWRVFSDMGFLGTLEPVGSSEFLAKFSDPEIRSHGVVGYQPWALVESLLQWAMMSPA